LLGGEGRKGKEGRPPGKGVPGRGRGVAKGWEGRVEAEVNHPHPH